MRTRLTSQAAWVAAVCTLAVVVGLTISAPAPALAHGLVDQQQTTAGGTVIGAFGQSFTPAVNNIVAFDVNACSVRTATYTIRQSPFTVDLVPPFPVSLVAGVNHIDIPGGPVPLTPGTKYAFIELSGSSAPCFAWAGADTYPGGGVVAGSPLTEFLPLDLYFKTYYLATPPPTISKAFTPSTILVNGTSTLSFTITNPLAFVLTGVSFTDTLPPGLVVALSLVVNSCGGTLTATPGTGSISLSGGTVNPGSCSISVGVTGTTAGPKPNTTGSLTTNETVVDGTASATLTVVAPVAPTTVKSFSPASIALNGTSALSFTITNNVAFPLTGVTFNDTLTAGVVVSTPPGIIGTCGAGTVAATAGGSTIGLTGGTIAASGSCTFSVNVTGTTAGLKPNLTSTVTSNEAPAGAPASASLTVAALGTPTITKAFGATSIALNGTTSLSFTITNTNATNPLTGVGFTDTLPPGLVVATPNGLTGNCGGGAIVATDGIVSLTGATLAAAASCTFAVNVTGTTAGLKPNVTGALISSAGTGGTAAASLTVATPGVTTISKSFGTNVIAVGRSTSLSFTITNPNASTALTGVAVSDTLPAGLVVATPNGLSGACGAGTITAAAGGSAISLTGGTLAAGGSCTFAVNVTGTTAGTKANTTSAVTSTEGGAGGVATASLVVAGQNVDLAFLLAAFNQPPRVVPPGGGGAAAAAIAAGEREAALRAAAAKATPQAAAPAVVAPPPAIAIVPPNTGDGGLKAGGVHRSPGVATVLGLIAVVVSTASGLLAARKRPGVR